MKQSAFVLLTLVLLSVEFSSGTPLSVTFYPNLNYSGDSVTFHNTNTNTACVNTLIGNISSFCVVGQWLFTGSTGFHLPVVSNGSLHCGRFSQPERFPSITAVRRLGPEDTTIPAIAFWSGSGVTNYTIVEKVAEANVNVVMTLTSSILVTYGSTNWTVFEGINFENKSACFTSKNVVDYTWRATLNMTTIGSTIKGCNFSNEYINQLRLGMF